MASEALADSLYDAFVERVESAEVVSSVPAIAVIKKDSGSTEDLVAQAQAAAGNSGACVFVTRPVLAPQAAATPWYSGSFLVEIAEDPTLNRGAGGTGKTAAQLEESIVSHLVFWTHGLAIGRLFVREANVPEEGAGNLRMITFGFGALIDS